MLQIVGVIALWLYNTIVNSYTNMMRDKISFHKDFTIVLLNEFKTPRKTWKAFWYGPKEPSKKSTCNNRRVINRGETPGGNGRVPAPPPP